MNERSRIEYVIGSDKYWGLEIKKKGKVDVYKFHKELIPWFEENQYNFLEKEIASKEKSDGKDEKFVWAASKTIDPYFTFNIQVEIIISKWRGDKAEIMIRFKGYLEKDPKELFRRRHGKLGEFLRKIYERYIIKDKVDKMSSQVFKEATDFINATKKILNLHSA